MLGPDHLRDQKHGTPSETINPEPNVVLGSSLGAPFYPKP